MASGIVSTRGSSHTLQTTLKSKCNYMVYPLPCANFSSGFCSPLYGIWVNVHAQGVLLSASILTRSTMSMIFKIESQPPECMLLRRLTKPETLYISCGSVFAVQQLNGCYPISRGCPPWYIPLPYVVSIQLNIAIIRMFSLRSWSLSVWIPLPC